MKNIALLAASTAALALVACTEEPAVDEVVVVDEGAEYSPMGETDVPMGGELSTEQQERYDAMDRDAVSREYDTNRDAEMAAAGQGSASSGDDAADMNASSSTTTSTSSGSDSADSDMAQSDDMDSGDAPAVAAIPPRSQMSFAYLDRNSDGQLSVAEYAIWAVPANPNTPVANDQRKPYISTEQINEAGRTFFFFDEDGDTYLSEGEFTTARNSARTPG